MLIYIAWIIEVLGIGAEAYSIIRLASRRRQLRGTKDWKSDPELKKWRRIGSVSYGVAMVNFLTFLFAGAPETGLIPVGVGFLLMFPLVILSGGEGEGAGE